MATATSSARSAGRDADVHVVDPRAPRFGQSITALGLLAGIILQEPAFVYAITAILVTAVLTQWRVQIYGLLWRNLVVPAVAEPTEPEPAAPHRFATVIGAVGTTVGSAAILLGVPLVGYVLAGAIAVAAGIGAATGFCLGCHMYRSVSMFRRLSIV